MLPPRNPLTSGKSKTWAVYVPEKLVEEIERQAAIDGFKKTSPYVVHLLLSGLKQREKEREEERAEEAKHK